MARTRLPRRNFCIRLRHNALSGLEIYRRNFYRSKFRRFALAAIFVTKAHHSWFSLYALSILNLMRARRISNKVWINPVPLDRRRKLLIEQWDSEILYQDFGFDKTQMQAILVVLLKFLMLQLFACMVAHTHILFLIYSFLLTRVKNNI